MSDVVVLDAGQLLPIDGTVLVAWVASDERNLTGESLPVERGPGSTVRAATVLLRAGAVRVGHRRGHSWQNRSAPS